jgi:hypothetical protein
LPCPLPSLDKRSKEITRQRSDVASMAADRIFREPAGGECKCGPNFTVPSSVSSRPKAKEAKSQGESGCSLLIWLGRWMWHRRLRRDLPKVSLLDLRLATAYGRQAPLLLHARRHSGAEPVLCWALLASSTSSAGLRRGGSGGSSASGGGPASSGSLLARRPDNEWKRSTQPDVGDGAAGAEGKRCRRQTRGATAARQGSAVESERQRLLRTVNRGHVIL